MTKKEMLETLSEVYGEILASSGGTFRKSIILLKIDKVSVALLKENEEKGAI
jgi:hypothetical protein